MVLLFEGLKREHAKAPRGVGYGVGIDEELQTSGK